MSIIYEALKKVETTSGNTDLGIKTPKKMHSAFKPYLIYVPAICLGFLIGGILLHYFTAPKKNVPVAAPKSLPEVPRVLETRLLPAEDAKPQKESQPLLILNGIFSSQNEGYALINNRIVKVGDDIEGATVTSIGQDSVELKLEGSVITLSNQSN